MLRAVVDLPQPDSPTRPRVRPAPISKETPATADTSPFSPPKTPPPTRKVFTRSRTESATSWLPLEALAGGETAGIGAILYVARTRAPETVRTYAGSEPRG